MQNRDEFIQNYSSHYTIQVIKAFGDIDQASKALEVIAKSLKEIYRYIEPSFYKGDFFVCKNLKDELCYEESDGTFLYDKNILLNKASMYIRCMGYGHCMICRSQCSARWRSCPR